MNTAELHALLDRLRAEPRETEWLEFKTNRYEPQLLGEYLSALANSAWVNAIFTGTRCTTLIQLPVAFSGGSKEKLLPVPAEKPTISPMYLTDWP